MKKLGLFWKDQNPGSVEGPYADQPEMDRMWRALAEFGFVATRQNKLGVTTWVGAVIGIGIGSWYILVKALLLTNSVIHSPRG
jgi:hypothetical protein